MNLLLPINNLFGICIVVFWILVIIKMRIKLKILSCKPKSQNYQGFITSIMKC